MSDARLLSGDFSKESFEWSADNDKEMSETREALQKLADDVSAWSAPTEGPNGCQISTSSPTYDELFLFLSFSSSPFRLARTTRSQWFAQRLMLTALLRMPSIS